MSYSQDPSRPDMPPAPPMFSQTPPPQVPAFGPPMVLQVARPSSGAAVWALVLGLVGVLFGWCLMGVPCLAAVVMGHVAVSATRNDRKSGRGMAVAGLALGYIALAPAIVLFFWLVVGVGAASTPGPNVSATP